MAVIIIAILLAGAMYSIAGCATGIDTRSSSTRLSADSARDQQDIEDTAALDIAAVGHPIWIAYPQDTLPSGAFKLYRYGAAEAFSQTDLPNIAVAPRDAVAVAGTAEDVAIALRSDTSLRALRVVQGRSFDEYPSVMRLLKALRNAGWEEVPGRPGLWVKPE